MNRRTTAALLGALAWALPAQAAAQTAAPAPAPGQISATGSPTDFTTGAQLPALSYDRVSGRVLALWQVRGSGDTRAVFGRVLDAHGAPAGAQFALPGFAATTTPLTVAARPRAGGWLVGAGVEVAARATRIVTAVVTSAGVPGTRRGISAAAPFADAGVASPQIAFDPRDGHGVIGWFLDTTHGRGGVYARAIDAAGRPAGAAHAIYRSAKGSDSIDGTLSLAFASRTHRWLVAWQHFMSFASTKQIVLKGVYTRRVLSDARPRGPVHALGRGADFSNVSLGTPTLATDTDTTRGLVLYPVSGGEDARNRLQAVRVDAGGAAVGKARTLDASVEPQAAISASLARGSGDGLLLTYVHACQPTAHEGCPQFAPLVSRVLTGKGAPSGASRVLVADAIGTAATVVATAAGSGLVAWEGAALSGPPVEDATAMATVFPHKSEIFVRAVLEEQRELLDAAR
jgi:hypothetical protein